MPHHDPHVTPELLAAVIGKSADSVKRDRLAGKIPPFDSHPDKKSKGWRLSTIAKWNPRAARQLEGLMKSPYLPAA